MESYLKSYNFVYEITARSLVVLQEDDVELIVHFT